MNDLSVVLDNVRSAYNVGSIFRTCEAAGVKELILGGVTPCPPHPKLAKTALGSTLTVPFTHHCLTITAIRWLKSQQIKIVALETGEKVPSIYEYKFTSQPTALVLGNEISGLGGEILAEAEVVKIPQFGQKESLNVATAAGVAIYEWVRQVKGL